MKYRAEEVGRGQMGGVDQEMEFKFYLEDSGELWESFYLTSKMMKLVFLPGFLWL